MNRLIKLLPLILISIIQIGCVHPDIINEIEKKCNAINNSIDNYDRKTNEDINVYKDISPNNYSFESTEIKSLAIINLDRFYDNEKLRKAVVQFDGGRADLISEYYFWNDTLIFVLKTRTDYEKPKWADDFNATSKTIKENRYYFNKDELIQWIESDKKQVDLSKVDKKIEKEIISDSKLYMHFN